MRQMSFSMTTPQVRGREKTVTRRLRWRFLKAGDLVLAIEKGQGLKRGEKVVGIGVIRILNVRTEYLRYLAHDDVYGRHEVAAEGFPGKSVAWFLEMFCQSHGCTVDDVVTRIEFEYV